MYSENVDLYAIRASARSLEILDFYFRPTPYSVTSLHKYSPNLLEEILDESKEVKDLKIDGGRRAVIDTFQDTANQTKLSLTAYAKIQEDYVKALKSLLTASKGLTGKKLTANQKSISDAVESNFLKAYIAGRSSTGSSFLKNFKMTKEEEAFVKAAANQEIGFAQRFLGQVAGSESGKFSDHRADMYGRTLESMFTNGWIGTLPEDSLVYWTLNARESCPDCIALAAKSPYSVGNSGKYRRLPTVPRAGSSRCLSSCRCTLRIILPDEEGNAQEPQGPVFKEPSIVTKKDTVQDDIYHAVEGKYTEMNRVRHQISLEDDLASKQRLMLRRTQLNQEIINIQEATGRSYIPSFSVADVTQTSKSLSGLARVSYSQLTKNQNVVIVRNTFSVPSVVLEVAPTSVRVTTPYGDFKISPDEDFLYFQDQQTITNFEDPFSTFRQ